MKKRNIPMNISSFGTLRKIGIHVLAVAILAIPSVVPHGVLAVATCTNGTLMNGICVPSGASTGLPETTASQLITNVMNWLLGIMGILAMLMFTVSGIQYLTAAGDEKATEHAKNNMKFAAMGVAVALLGYAVVYTIYQVATGTGIGSDYSNYSGYSGY